MILNLLFVKGYCLLHPAVNCLSERLLVFYLYLNLVWLILVFVFGANKIDRNTHKKQILFTYLKIIVFYFFLFLLYFQVVSLSYYSRDDIKYLFPAFFVLLIAWKFSLYFAFWYYRKLGYNYRNVLILGFSPQSNELKDYFRRSYFNGYRFIGFIDNRADPAKEIIGSWTELKKCVETHDIHEIYLAWDRVPLSLKHEIVEVVNEFPVRVRIVPELGEFSFKSIELINYDLVPVLQIHPGPLSFWYNRLIKRLFDIALSVLVIVCVLSWLIPVIYLLTLAGSRQGMFFLQKRTGIDGKVFRCYKFRTMRKNNDAHLQQAVKNDGRVTVLGRLLRKTSMDELPQFINVLLGQMSVVGPRPHMLQHTDQYRRIVKKFMLRHTVKPGITGLAQVRGYRGEIQDQSEIEGRVSLDANYIENWSFGLDLKIIFLTLIKIIKGDKNAY